MKKSLEIKRMMALGILGGLVAALSMIKIPLGQFSITLALIPLVVGAILYGPKGGSFLGFVMGFVVLFVDAAYFYGINPIGTIITVLVKSTAAGFAAGWIYKILKKFNSILATFAAAAIVPILNTGLFILGCLMISDTIAANFVAEGSTVIYFLVIGCAGFNFIFEFLINIIFSPALHRIMEVVSKRLKF